MTRSAPFAIALCLTLCLTLQVRDAQACSCIASDVVSSYGMSSDVAVARVVWGAQVGGTQWYIARVRLPLKGCLTKGAWLYVKTNVSSAACGVTLKVGHTYLLNGNASKELFGVPVLSIGSCLTQKKVSALTKTERKWLSKRYVCCGEKCLCATGKPPVSCFVDPCSVAAPCPSGDCQSNYCGGCNAEFYDAGGFLVCGPCESDKDCSFGQTCSDGKCQAECFADADCGADSWCSPTMDGKKQCKPFQQEGDWCGGFTPVWAQSKCAPSLICTDVPEFIADAPGICRKKCKENSNCDKDQYCGSGGVCRDDATCWKGDDCEADGNDYVMIDCIGYGSCNDDKLCEWKCGEGPPKWYSTCGNPVCGPDDAPPAGTPPCMFGQKQGADCKTEGALCDAKLGCGAALVCATSDPKAAPGGCPISKLEYKNQVRYLNDAQLATLYREVLDMKIASWVYKGGPPSAAPRLGFIIDDNPKSASVAADGQQVDLYAYATMAMAALKVQAKQIDSLTERVETLTQRLERQRSCTEARQP